VRALLLLISLIIGLAAGIVGAFLQAARLLVGGWTIPWGLLVTLVALVVLIRGVLEVTSSRWGGWLVFAGWLIATIIFAAEMPSGAVVISAGDRQMAYLVAGVIVGAAAATIPPLQRLRSGPRSNAVTTLP